MCKKVRSVKVVKALRRRLARGRLAETGLAQQYKD
jgi:hypothetical protein